jgi:hypothetical protein
VDQCRRCESGGRGRKVHHTRTRSSNAQVELRRQLAHKCLHTRLFGVHGEATIKHKAHVDEGGAAW